MNRKPASIGALVMLGGGLLVYWALSQWGLFGLGGDKEPDPNRGKNLNESGQTPLESILPRDMSGGGGSSRF
jgi:hypothetical protein